jgi:hypothetical protein
VEAIAAVLGVRVREIMLVSASIELPGGDR